MSVRPNVSDSELEAFTLAVKQRFGIDFTAYEPKSLKRGIARMMMRNGFRSILDFWSSVLRDRNLMTQYIDELLVNLTEFFRNYEAWIKIQQEVLQTLAFEPTLKIWHAGCSTGEEGYSMAIVLKERFLHYKADILATDLSTKALEKAKEGIYNKFVFQKSIKTYTGYNPDGDISRYFQQQSKGYRISDSLRKHITFERHNLVQERNPEQYHLIFCRNVMIYFDENLKLRVLRKLHSNLLPNGFLVIGYYDMLPEAAEILFEPFCASTRIYKKKGLDV